MCLMLFGLLCLCFVSFGRADMLSGSRSLAREDSEENDKIEDLFSLMDKQTEQDEKITIDEFKQTWLQHDTDEDEMISEDELRTALEKSNVKYSEEAKFMFLYLDLSEEGLREWFQSVDLDRDRAITKYEFKRSYLETDT